MSDEPKSAYELAMERLRQKDADQGIVETPLTDAQRAAIVEAKTVYEARLAQAEIMHWSKAAGIVDPEAREKLDEEYRRDLRQITGDRDRALDKIRRGP